MQITGDARPLADSRFQLHIELLRDLMEPEPMKAPEQRQKSGHARHLEPTGLIVRREDGKIKGRAGLVPHAAVIAGCDAEAVIAWRKIVIERLSFIANVFPVGIAAFQPDAKTDLLRRD